jgi:hypothetical protein
MKKDTEMKFHQMTQAGDNHSYQLAGKARIHVLEIFRVIMKLYLNICVFCIGTVAAMGSGSGGSGGGSVESKPLQEEVGGSAFKVYNQGVDLMHAKKVCGGAD